MIVTTTISVNATEKESECVGMETTESNMTFCVQESIAKKGA